jgi:hypothetical protein
VLRSAVFLQSSAATDQQAHDAVDNYCGRDRNEQRTDERWPKRRPYHSRKNMPVHVIVEPELAEMHTLSCWPIQDPTPKLILSDIQRRHGPNHYVVQRHSNRSCDLVATADPCHSNRQQRLQRIQRGEAKENSDRRPKRDRVRRVGDRHQGHVMRDEPLL